MVVVGLGSYVKENAWVGCVQLLVEDLDFADIGVGVQVEEESVGGVFWNGCIHMAGWSWGARRFELEQSSSISVDTKSEVMTIESDFTIVETETGLVHEAGEDYGADERNFD